jgi:ABC-type antimicrobial peptide transport system permease subunit
VAARERRAEYAILRALGVDRRSVGRSIALETGFIVICGIVAGLLVAAILSWVVLPSVGLTPDGRPPVPGARIEWPAGALLVAAVAGIGLWLVLAAIARRQVHPERTATTLREGIE